MMGDNNMVMKLGNMRPNEMNNGNLNVPMGPNDPNSPYSPYDRNIGQNGRPLGPNGSYSPFDRNNGPPNGPNGIYSPYDRNNGPNGQNGPYSSFDRNNGPNGPNGPHNGQNGPYSSFDRNNIPNGPNGPNRPNGPNGPNGLNGPNGSNGPNGPNGPNRPNGPNGPNGPNEPYSSFDRNNIPNGPNVPSNRSIEGSLDRNDNQYPSIERSSTDSNEEPEENIIRVYAGNIELKTSYKSIKIEEGMTARDILLIAMERFRIPKDTIDEYYIGVIHFESQEKQLRPDASIMNVIRNLNSKGLPGITVSSRSSLINANINLLDTRFIKFFLNRKIAEQEKDFKLIRIFIEKYDDSNRQIHKTIGVMEHEKVVDVINNALTKFSAYQNKNPYDFTLISLFNNQQIPRNYDDSIYEILGEVAKYKRRSIIDIDFLLKPNTEIPVLNTDQDKSTPVNPSNSKPNHVSLQKQLLMNAGVDKSKKLPSPDEFKPPARKSSNAGKPVFPKRSASKSEKHENVQNPEVKTVVKPSEDIMDEPPSPPTVPPPPPPSYLPFTDGARYDSDNNSNPPRKENQEEADPNASFVDPPRFGSLVPLEGDKNTNEASEIDDEMDDEDPPRFSSLENKEEEKEEMDDENPPRLSSLENKGEKLEEESEEEIKTSVDKNNLFNNKNQSRARDSIYSDVGYSNSFMSETNELKDNLFTLNNILENDSENNNNQDDIDSNNNGDQVQPPSPPNNDVEEKQNQNKNENNNLNTPEPITNENEIINEETPKMNNQPPENNAMITPPATPEVPDNNSKEDKTNEISEDKETDQIQQPSVKNTNGESSETNENEKKISENKQVSPNRNNTNSLVFSPRVSSAADQRGRRNMLKRQVSNSSSVSSKSPMHRRGPEEGNLERSVSSASEGAIKSPASPNAYALRKTSSVKVPKLVHHPPQDINKSPAVDGSRRHQRSPVEGDRSMMDDRSVISDGIRDDRSVLSDRSIIRDSEGRLIQNDRRMRPRRPSPNGMRPRRPSRSPVRDGERMSRVSSDGMRGERTPRMGERTPRMGERTPRMSERTPRMGERTPRMGERTPRMSERTPRMSERTPRMSERRPPRGSEHEDIMPPRERRPPRGPPPEGSFEDGMPPHMRERRSRGLEDGIPPHMRERPHIGERTPRMGEKTPRMNERTPRMNERTPRMGERTPRMSERTPRMGERTPRMGERRPGDPRDPRMSRSCSPNRRRPGPPLNGSNPRPGIPSSHDGEYMNSPRSGYRSPARNNSDVIYSPNSSLGRDPTGMNMHKPMSPFRSPRSMTSSPVTSLISPDGRQNSLNREHGIKLGINNIERKLSSNSARSLPDHRNIPNNHRRNGSVSSSLSTHSTSSDRPPKSSLRKSQNGSYMETTPKTPLIVNNVDELKAHSAQIQTVNEFGEIKSNESPLVESSQIIDFTKLLNSIDTTLQDKSFNVRSNTSTPISSRKNSNELEKIRSARKSRFEDMEKLLDNTIQNNKVKSRANETPVKVIKHESKHFDDSHLRNLLEQLSMTTNNLEKESRSAPVTAPVTAQASAPLSAADSAPNLNEDFENDLEDTEATIKKLQQVSVFHL